MTVAIKSARIDTWVIVRFLRWSLTINFSEKGYV